MRWHTPLYGCSKAEKRNSQAMWFFSFVNLFDEIGIGIPLAGIAKLHAENLSRSHVIIL